MARQINPEETFDDLHDELDYTEARLLDEEDAQALAPRIEAWRTQVERPPRRRRARCGATRRERKPRSTAPTSHSTARATTSRGRCRSRSGVTARARASAPSFASLRRPSSVRPLKDQTTAVRGWLTESRGPPVLEEHRPRLERTTARSEAALGRGTGLATRRGNLWTDREALAAYLTKERDALEDELATIARAKGHDRHWARSFFRTRRVRPPRNDANDGGGTT